MSFHIYVNVRLRRDIQISSQMLVLSTYAPGAKLSLHQDKDEPVCARQLFSVSLGLPAIFQFGGLKRNDPLKRLLLEHGDVVVWGGESRLFYHGIQPLKAGFHPLTTDCRYNLTFRQAVMNKNKIIIAVRAKMFKLRAVIHCPGFLPGTATACGSIAGHLSV